MRKGQIIISKLPFNSFHLNAIENHLSIFIFIYCKAQIASDFHFSTEQGQMRRFRRFILLKFSSINLCINFRCSEEKYPKLSLKILW